MDDSTEMSALYQRFKSDENKTNDDSFDVPVAGNLIKDNDVTFLGHVLSMWYLVVFFLTPFLCLPIILCVGDDFQNEARCGYVICVMAIYWTTEAIPIAITSLLPVVLFPMLGVLTAKQTSGAYFNDTSMLFVGGLLVAIAIEVWDVHKRIALMALRIVGSEPRCLLLGITLVTWFLSMWISNTATTAMMMTIVQELMVQFENLYDPQDDSNKISHTSSIESQNQPQGKVKSTKTERLGKALCLTVAYAANIGGVGALTGTGPNLVLVSFIDQMYEDKGLTSPVTFSTWLIYGFPISLICAVIMWAWMCLFILRCSGGCSCCPCCIREEDREKLKKVDDVIRNEYDKLGPVSYGQKTCIFSFVFLVFLWISRDFGGAGGWGHFFKEKYVRDSTAGLLMGVLMFVLPSSLPQIFCQSSSSGPYQPVTPLLTWKHIQEKMPWMLYLLLGGGYSIALAATKSGLSKWLGQELLVFKDLDQWLLLLVICYIAAFATEVTSNTAMATLMMPIMSEMALSLKLNPLFFMFPVALAVSFAFMLPVATPPNAIVFANSNIRVIDMVSCGFILNLVCVPVLVLGTATWGNAYFHFDQVPVEFSDAWNASASALDVSIATTVNSSLTIT